MNEDENSADKRTFYGRLINFLTLLSLAVAVALLAFRDGLIRLIFDVPQARIELGTFRDIDRMMLTAGAIILLMLTTAILLRYLRGDLKIPYQAILSKVKWIEGSENAGAEETAKIASLEKKVDSILYLLLTIIF